MGLFWQPPLGGVGNTPDLDLDPLDSPDDSFSVQQLHPSADPDGDDLAEEDAPGRRSQQAEIDIRCDEARRGQRWPEAERRLLIEQRIRELEDLDRWVEASVELHRLRLEVASRDRDLAETRHRELIETVERGNVVAKVGDYAMAHPFLAGFVGSAIVGSLRKWSR